MQEQLVSFETADIAFKKGFDERCWNFAWNDNKTIKCCLNKSTFQEFHYQKKFQEENNIFTISIPTQSFLQRWLREEHDIHCTVDCNASGWGWFIDTIHGTHLKSSGFDGPNDGGRWNVFEEAFEIGLQEALKLIPNETEPSQAK